MKPFEEIAENTQIQLNNNVARMVGINGISGYLLLRGEKQAMSFMASIDKNPDGISWEHVSVSILDEKRKTPTWEQMCRVKEIFWREDEEVHQIHPKAQEYVHGVGHLDNVLHLWRPVGGWSEEE